MSWIIDVSFELNGCRGHEIVETNRCGMDAYIDARKEFAKRAKSVGCWNVVDTFAEGTRTIVDNVPNDIVYTPIKKDCGCEMEY